MLTHSLIHRTCQSREIEFIRVVGCLPAVMPDEHHHVYWQIDDVADCFHIALTESEGAGYGIFLVGHHSRQCVVAVIVLTRLHLYGQYAPLIFNDKVKFALFLAVEIIQKITLFQHDLP